jgi:hypothetical protein
MLKTAYALSIAALGGMLLGCSGEDRSEFIVCESTYALCTTAQCTPVAGEAEAVSCDCEVKTGYSAGQKPCANEAETSKGKQINSRYFPIKSYVACDNGRPWAWCLDKPCIVDSDDPSKASCACSVVKDEGTYLAVTESYSETACTTGLLSSATVKGLDQVTDFLKGSDKLKPFEIKVLSKPE